MWKKVLYAIYALLLISFNTFSQVADGVLPKDTIKNMLSDERAQQVIGISDEFQMAWIRLPVDQQDKIISQISSLMNNQNITKKIREAYFESVVKSVNLEANDTQKITGYLNVTDKVIENYSPARILDYFKTVSELFEYNSLHYSRSNRLFLAKGTYTFEYIDPQGSAELDAPGAKSLYEDDLNEEETPVAEDDYFDDWDEEPTDDDDWNTEWEEEYEEQQDPDELMIEAIRGGAALPAIEGPIIKVENADLNLATAYDSVFIQNTSGSFLIFKNEFVGEGGKFDWTIAGLNSDSVYCTFPEYSFNVTRPQLEVESAKLTYKGKLDQPVDGVFAYKSVKHDTTTDSKYPRFISYYSDVPVKNIGKNIIYEGGFSLNGSKINSSSVMGEMSKIEVFDEVSKKFRARAKIFEFQDSVITTKRASVVIYQDNDSIYHPAVQLKYDYNNQNLVLQKDKGGFRNTPYTSTYFNMDFTADIIRWDIKSDSLDASILEARRIVPAYFESSDHYSFEDYRDLGDKIYPFNPLAMVVSYSKKVGMDEFYVDQLARNYKKDPNMMRGAMQFLAQKGLIGYDASKGLVIIKKKTRHLFNSRFGRKDFDNLIIASVIHNKPNSTINFKDNYMKVRGVESFKVSDSLNVLIEPDSSEITILKNRDVKFNGKITAGNFEYIGKEFYFKYDSFLINMNKIYSIQFYVQDEDSRGFRGRKKVDNSMVAMPDDSLGTDDSNTTLGTLYINKPNNKSGKVKYTNFPKFDAGRGALVYFDREEVLGGVYDRSLKFEVPPFDIDSLSGEDPSSIEFEGGFQSGGIFPDFKEKLVIMPDNSLGFNHTTPSDGYQLYHKDARFYNEIVLNKKGLQGKGKIAYLTSDILSDNFVFYPDSVVASGETVEIQEGEKNGVSFPQVSILNYDMKWLPKKDSMYVSNKEKPIEFYNNTASLDGTAIISKNGVFGKGTLITGKSESKSDEITFRKDKFSARHAEFELKSDNPDKPALAGSDVNLKFNRTENYAVISPENEGEAAIEFPYAQFKTSITEATWDLNNDKISMKKPDDVPLESSYFYTTREDLDSLRFNATEAVYDINTSELKVSGIPYIVVADAKITPENNEVLILENSRIGRLTNTTIVLDTLNGYHKLTEGVIDIISRNEFTGYATYNFINALNDTVPVKMENFHLEKIPVENSRKKDVFEQHTVANGSVSENQNIFISPGMFYKGDMILYAHRPAMELDGYIKLDIHEPGYDTWIAHSSTGEQKQIMIDFDNSITEDGRKLEAGLYFSAGDNSLYNSFVAQKYSPDDDDFFTASGLLYYDQAKNEYTVEDTLKTAGKKLSGKVYRYNQDNKQLRFEGPVSFMRPTQDVSIKSSVLGTGSTDTNEYNLNASIAVNFASVPSQAFDIMARDILDVLNNLGAPEGLGDQTQLLYKLADIIGERAAKEYEKLSLQEYVSLGNFTKETAVPLMFSNVDLKWSSDYKAFYNEGKLGLSNINRTDINGAFDGFMEITKNEGGGGVFNVFIKASPASWFFFSYEDDRLLIYSSNENLNNFISSKSNGAKAKIGELVFAPADKAETLNFINKFRLQYYGIDEFYDLDSEIKQEEIEVQQDGFGGTEKESEVTEDDDGF